MSAKQPPLFPAPCPVCRYAADGEHEPWCASFMRGAAVGGDPVEWPTLLDDPEPSGAVDGAA